MKTTFFSLSVFFFSLLVIPCKAYTANTPSTYTPERFSIHGQQLTPINHNNQLFYLVTSETDGLLLLDEKQTPKARLAGHFSQSDILLQKNGRYLVAALNSDTYDAELYTLNHDLTVFSALTFLAAGTADLEAICLATSDNIPVLTTVNTTGVMRQHIIKDTNALPLRTINVGTGIKSCQSSSVANSIFLADEYVGLWRYPFHAESDGGKSLIASDEGTESVGMDGHGLVARVSPAKPVIAIELLGARHTVTINGDVELESVRIARFGDVAVAGLYDDKSGSLYTLRFPYPMENDNSVPTIPVDASLQAFAQTEPVARFGDAADDPAIWYFADVPMKSVIIGTDKKSGLNLYDLSGKQLQHLPVGRLNNVDVRTHWHTPNGTLFLAAATNRTSRTIDVFKLDNVSRSASPLAKLPSSLNDLYGLCLYHNDSTLDILANDTDGNYERHRLSFDGSVLNSEVVETFSVPSQPEGCVADDENGVLYYGEENKGIWKRSLIGTGNPSIRIAEVGGKVKDDIEGMALFDVDDDRYLVVSSQGNHRYAVYATTDNHKLLGTFDIITNYEKHIDGVSETDGLEAISLPISNALPEGLLVVQDGHNVMPSQPQNFKLVNGSALAAFIRAHR